MSFFVSGSDIDAKPDRFDFKGLLYGSAGTMDLLIFHRYVIHHSSLRRSRSRFRDTVVVILTVHPFYK